jgi:lipopolysaccharide/colanic/teichoic acid biosynthesis glycosyltransferase
VSKTKYEFWTKILLAWQRLKKVNALCLGVVLVADVVVVVVVVVVCLHYGDGLYEQQRVDEHEDAGDDID